MTASGGAENRTLAAARAYLARGWFPVSIPRGEKGPLTRGWQKLRLTDAELPRHFKNGQNVGLLLGEPSASLVDIDLDAKEAVAGAPAFLPPTPRRHGRPGKPGSHWWYVSDPIPRPQSFKDVDGTMLCELRSTGQQTVVPPSLHPSGEELRWEEEGEPARCSMGALRVAVAKVASSALIARRWPSLGSRHEVALALGGVLLRAGLPEDDAVALVETAARVAGDEEWRGRGADVRTTARRLASGEPVTGATVLASLLRDGEAVVAQLRRWLGLRGGLVGETPYYASTEGLFWRRPTQGGTVPVRLTNFTAQIVADITEDDGVDRRHLFEIEASVAGSSVRAAVPANQFQAMTWAVELLGAGAVVFPSMGLRDHARAAVQLLSSQLSRRTIYTHTGWCQLGDQWVYLHAGGAIGAVGPVAGIEVHPPEALARFALPAPASGAELEEAIAASLRMLNLGPDRITIPLLAAVFRSALGPADFGVQLTGRTGTGKTELAALAQQHFGPEMDARHLPASWSSTGNALEGVAFAAKDAILVVDDFAPTGASWDIQRYHREADRLFRAQGNNAGRQRMRADATVKAAKPPRGLILSTGEDVPRGHSLRARLLVVEVSPTGLAWAHLSECQADAALGRYAHVLAAFVQWLAPRYGELQQRVRAEVATLREIAFRSEQHRRTATIIGDLAVGWRFFLEFAQAVQALTPEVAEQLWARGWRALGELAEDQTRHQRVSDPVRLFLDLLSGAIASGRAHIAGPDGEHPEDSPRAWGWRLITVGAGDNMREEWRPGGDRVGWVDADGLYLDPQAAFAAVQGLGRVGGEQISIAQQTLARRLQEQGLLVRREEARGVLTVRRTLEDKRRDVLHLQASALTPPEPDQPDQEPPSGGPARGGSPDEREPPVPEVGLVGSRLGRGGRGIDPTLNVPLGATGPLTVQDRSNQPTAGIDPSGWPAELPGLGPRCPRSFTPCHACGRGTWVSYGDAAFCRLCAVAAYTMPPAGNGAPKSPPERSGTTSSEGPELDPRHSR